jgi:hypothetical protein
MTRTSSRFLQNRTKSKQTERFLPLTDLITHEDYYLAITMLFSPQSVLIHGARSVKVATQRLPIAVSMVQAQWFSTEPAPPAPKPKKVERGVLFSAPCLDPEIRLAAEEQLVAEDSVVNVKPTKVEKGFLFSAPCLEMNRDGQLKTEEKIDVVADLTR